ncbi:MAG TPA: CDGSH iron-sulfur domain-containing protein [Actinomycetota bacterium]|nr:CDGSH iron-sulfur domain-containing protein [Actinomycetota bacterium]
MRRHRGGPPGALGRLVERGRRLRQALRDPPRRTPPALRSPPTTVTLYPDGPYVVRGTFRVTDAQGREIPLPRKTVALCRCGLSETLPWCDGSHRAVWPREHRGDERRAS